MNIRRIYAIIVRQYFLYRHHPTRFVTIFVWAGIDVLLWGFLTKYLTTVGQSGFNFTGVLLSAVILSSFLNRSMQGVTMTFMEDMWSQNFLNIFASPIKISEYLSAMILSSILTSAVGLIFVSVFATFAFSFNLLIIGVLLWMFLLVIFIFGIALGILGVSLLLKFGPSAEWLVWPISALISPFAGVFYSVSILPAWMQFIAKLLPPSYVFESMRGLFAGGDASLYMNNLLIGLGLSFIYLILSYLVFILVHRVVLRRGLLARFSTEGT